MKYTFLNPTNGTTLEGSGMDSTQVAFALGILDGDKPRSPWLLLKVTDDNGAIVWLSNVTI